MSLGYAPSPAEALTPPPAAPGDWAQSARASAGIVVGGVDYVIKSLTGFSPLEEWVFKPLAGDWGALDRSAVAWTNAGRAMKTACDNVNAAKGQIGDAWEGETADAYLAMQDAVAADLADLPAACDEASTMVSALSQAAQAIAELIGAAINEVANIAICALASLSVPVAGEIAQVGWIAKLVAAVGKWSVKLQQAITRFIALAQKLVQIGYKILDVMVRIAKMLEKLHLVSEITSPKQAVPSIITMGAAAAKAATAHHEAAGLVDAWDGV